MNSIAAGASTQARCRRAWCLVCVAVLLTTAAHATPPPLELVNVYSGGLDLSKYWVSEKYDGVRGYWDGHRLISRGGHPFHPPLAFTAGWPTTPMDGELWGGRGRFERTESTVRAARPDAAAWRHIHYMVFDFPSAPGSFDARLRQLRRLFTAPHPATLRLVEQSRVADAAALHARMHAVVAAGGEGLVLHRGGARYHAGRTGDLLKLKPYDDAEARVIAYLPGKGRNTGRLGALLVERPDGARFHLGGGFTDAQREQPPPINSWVTYRYNGLTVNGLPRFPRFVRVRRYMPPPDP